MKRVSIRKLTTISMVAGGEKKINRVVRNGHVLCWVGFGWVDEGPARSPEHDNIPRVKEN